MSEVPLYLLEVFFDTEQAQALFSLGHLGDLAIGIHC